MDMIEIVRRRIGDRQPQDWLFHELADEKNAGYVFGKRFAQYRQKLGVNDVAPGRAAELGLPPLVRHSGGAGWHPREHNLVCGRPRGGP